MKFTDILFEEVKDIWESYLNHPFVKEIGEGTLLTEKFKRYIIQDYLYLKEFAKVFSMGVIKSDTIKEINELCSNLDEVEIEKLKEIFVKSSLYELEFWNMAYEEEMI